MVTPRPFHFFALAALLMGGGTAASSLRAQEFTVSGGVLIPRHANESTYSWQMEFRQELNRYFAASAAWINEGHMVGHHRDGTAWQGWVNFPFWRDHVALSFGAGAYFFFDTQSLADGKTADVHGVAPIFGGSATFYISERGFLRLNANRISRSQGAAATTATLGVGYWLGEDTRPRRRRLRAPPRGDVTDEEFTVFVGESVVNTFFNENSIAAAIEYRRGIAKNLDWTATYLNEGDPDVIRRNGFATQIWPVAAFLGNTVTLGFGVGPYVYFENKADGKRTMQKAGIAPLLSPTVSLRINEDWLVRVVWDRVVSNYDRDADVFLLGIGRRWR
jgi:hypothetical protein